MSETTPDPDVPAESQGDSDHAQSAALADRARQLTDDRHSRRAWAMDPRRRDAWASGLGVVHSRFERPLPSAEARLGLRLAGGVALLAAGGAVIGLALVEVPILSELELVSSLAAAGILLAYGIGTLWWVLRSGRRWARQELYSEFE